MENPHKSVHPIPSHHHPIIRKLYTLNIPSRHDYLTNKPPKRNRDHDHDPISKTLDYSLTHSLVHIIINLTSNDSSLLTYLLVTLCYVRARARALLNKEFYLTLLIPKWYVMIEVLWCAYIERRKGGRKESVLASMQVHGLEMRKIGYWSRGCENPGKVRSHKSWGKKVEMSSETNVPCLTQPKERNS